MIIFVCSPYLAILQNTRHKKQALKLIYKYAKAGSRAVKEMGYIPLSPVLCLQDVYDESTERDKALYASNALLKASQGIMVVKTPYNAYSRGMAKEIEMAKELGISIYETECKEIV